MSTTRAMAAAITSGVAIGAGMLAGGSGLAHADPDDSAPSSTTPFTSNGDYANIRSIVYWTGPYCIPVRAPGYPEGHHTMITSICGQNSVANYIAYPGEFVGADPMPNDNTVSLGCALYINGYLDNSDYAPPGDHHDVNCLRILVGYGPGPGSAQDQM